MKRISFFILQILLGLLPATATAPEELPGTVTDADTGEPIQGVVVRTRGAFTSTDRDGRFNVRLREGADSISFRCLGYETVTLPVTADVSTVRLSSKATRLRDVVVEAPDIYARGDTLVFNVDRYADVKDNAIIDVIKRLPGITVEKDGTIKYQGKPINRFYLDGSDVMGGQYGLATNNISYKDVKSVEVMENHQPVKALEGIEFPEEAGINLKLKEDARSRWVGVAKGAAGVSPLLYDGSLFAMRMARKVQNMITLKADNTGWNPANEITEHDFNDMFRGDYETSLWPEYISADAINAPLSEKRTRDNLSWLANAITGWKRGDTSMRLKLNCAGDRLDYTNGVSTDYLSPSIPAFVQNNSMRTQAHDLSAQFNSETNKREYFMKDRLTLSGSWNSSRSAITGSRDLTQRVRRTTLSAVNDLKLVKCNDRQLFTAISRNSFTHNPGRLTVDSRDDAVQSVGVTDVRSTTESQYGRLTRFWKFYITGGLDFNYRHLDMELSGMEPYDNSSRYDAILSNLYATPKVDYTRGRWRLSLSVPLKWLHQSVRSHHNYVNAMPGVYLQHQLTAKSELSASASYGVSSPGAYMDVDAPVLADYRNLFIANSIDRYSTGIAVTAAYKYRNPLKALFINMSATYRHRRSAVMSNQLFTDDIIISTYADRLSNSDSWNVTGGLSKGLGHSRMVTGLEVNASTSSARSMRDYTAIPYRQLTLMAKPYFKGSLLRWLSVNYEAEYGFTRLRADRVTTESHSLSHNLFATLIPNDNIQLTVGAEHFLTVLPSGNRANLVLLDASATWQPNGRIRVSLTADNLLGQRRYEYVTYGSLSRSEYYFQLRPRTILASIQVRL